METLLFLHITTFNLELMKYEKRNSMVYITTITKKKPASHITI